MNDWRDVRSFQIITDCHLFSVSIADIKRKGCPKIISWKSYIRYLQKVFDNRYLARIREEMVKYSALD